MLLPALPLTSAVRNVAGTHGKLHQRFPHFYALDMRVFSCPGPDDSRRALLIAHGLLCTLQMQEDVDAERRRVEASEHAAVSALAREQVCGRADAAKSRVRVGWCRR